MKIIDSKMGLGVFSGNRRTSIRMSKLARTLQTAAAKTNWEETVKMLFWADMDRGRSEEIRKLVASRPTGGPVDSYSFDQFRYMLLLMLIISMAEVRTQEVYNREFAERCDAISKDHHLQDDLYWKDGSVPAEWEKLSQEFEQRSLQVLGETLREYSQGDIARLIETDGADQLFNILDNLRSQFFNVLENTRRAAEGSESNNDSSIPETLQPAAGLKDPTQS